jgi:hypothetical protein
MTVQQKESLKKSLQNKGGQTLTDDGAVDSTALSWAAETADGTRDETMFLVLEDGKALKVKKESQIKNPNDPKLAKVYTKNKQHRPKVERVLLHVEDQKKPIELPGTEAWDSVFWTESSVEKFLWPYYHAHRLWDDQMTALQKKFEQDPKAVAVAHKAPSASATLPLSGIDLCGVARATRDATGILSLAWLVGQEYLALKE